MEFAILLLHLHKMKKIILLYKESFCITWLVGGKANCLLN